MLGAAGGSFKSTGPCRRHRDVLNRDGASSACRHDACHDRGNWRADKSHGGLDPGPSDGDGRHGHRR